MEASAFEAILQAELRRRASGETTTSGVTCEIGSAARAANRATREGAHAAGARGNAPWATASHRPGQVPSTPSRPGSAPACLEALGLDAAATTDAVRRAFRRLAFERHPDRGGSPEAFVALEAAYRDALRLVRRAA